jgi:hypothetical protein
VTHEAPVKNPLALALVIIGSLAMVASAFLPLYETVTSIQIERNTLIQHGRGWTLVVIALAIVAYAYRLNQGQSHMSWSPLVLCAAAALVLIWIATDTKLRTLYPVVAGEADTDQPGVVASLGIAIYLAGTGVACAAIGSLMLRQSTSKTRAMGDDEH